MSPHVERPRSAAEWVTLALSLIIVGSFVAVAIIEESRRLKEPETSLSVSFDDEEVRIAAGNYYVPYTVTNTGASAILSADVWLEVFAEDELVESAEITIESLPLQGKQHGIYVSRFDPNSHQLRGRLESLQFP